MLPRLHIITDADVVRAPSFLDTAAAVLECCGEHCALHLRGHGLGGRLLHELGVRLSADALRTGAWLLVNDRVDVAMAVRANGVQLGSGSLAVGYARSLLGAGARIGVSAHGVAEVVQAEVDGADFALLGNIYETASHPGRRALGTGELERAAGRARLPVIAIGGITRERIEETARTGAYGVAVLGAVWRAAQPADAIRGLVEAVRMTWSDSR